MRNLLLLAFLIICLKIDATSQPAIRSFSLIDRESVEVLTIKPRCYIEFTSKHFNSRTLDSVRYLQGKILSITDTSIIIAPTYDYIIRRYHTDSIQQFIKQQKDANYSVNLGFKNIEQVNYQTYNSQNWNGIGISSMIIGGIISLFVAPLISLNYKEGGFNSSRYLTCASIGLGCIMIGIPITVCNQEKEFYLNQPENSKRKTIWKFK